LEVVNRYDFRDLSHLALEWRLERDGVSVARGVLAPASAAAGARQAVDVSAALAALRAAQAAAPGGELVLTVGARSKAAEPGVEQGALVGWSQFVLASAAPAASQAGWVTPQRVGDAYELRAGGALLRLQADTGLLTYSVAGQPLLKGGSPNFWRGLTDNDEGAGVNKSHAIWKTFTEQRKVRAISVDGDSLKVLFSFGAGAAHWENVYRMRADGALEVAASFTPLRDDLPDPLRLGLRFDSAAGIDQLRWYGRGPQESYADRQTGAALGLYQGSLADQYHSYIRPQESGNKTDVRWLALSGKQGGVKVSADAPFSFNALAFPYEDLYLRPRGTWKSSEIAPHGEGSLLIDMAQAGVGGDTGWSLDGRPHVKYRIPLASASYRFVVTPSQTGMQ
jgi:beta-galactosidase